MTARRSPLPAMKLPAFLFATATLLGGCDQISQQLGLDEPQRREARADAEGRAVGSGCRQSGRAIEDCYSVYRWLPKASIFAGWREMNDYMLANNIGVVEPKLPPAPGPEDKKKSRLAAASNGEVKSSEAKPAENEAKLGDKTDPKGETKTGDQKAATGDTASGAHASSSKH